MNVDRSVCTYISTHAPARLNHHSFIGGCRAWYLFPRLRLDHYWPFNMASRESIQQDDFLNNPPFEAICEQMQSAANDILIEDGDQESQDAWTGSQNGRPEDLLFLKKTRTEQSRLRSTYRPWKAFIEKAGYRYVFPFYGAEFYTNKALALLPQMAHQGIKSLYF